MPNQLDASDFTTAPDRLADDPLMPRTTFTSSSSRRQSSKRIADDRRMPHLPLEGALPMPLSSEELPLVPAVDEAVSARRSIETQQSDLIDAIRAAVGEQRFAVWFSDKNTRLRLRPDMLEIVVANDFIAEWIGKHFVKTINDVALESLGHAITVTFNVNPRLFEQSSPSSTVGRTEPGEVAARAVPAVVRRSVPQPAAAESKRPRLRHDLDAFVVGGANKMAYDCALAVSEFPGGQYNPLFIHGPVGLGKTHLLQGISKRFAKLHPAKKWAYLTGEEFTNEFLTALRSNRLDTFRRKMRDLDLLVIDDVHFLGGKKATQEEFLHTFNAIEAVGKQVVLASDNHPKLIQAFSESLINRFVSGMTVRVDPPNQNMREELIRVLAKRHKMELTDEVIKWVATRVTQNIRELEGAITRLKAHVQLTGATADVELARQCLTDLERQHNQPLQPEAILEATCEYFGLDRRDLMSGRRQRTISLARSIAMYLVRKTSKLSFPEIANRLGKRNHSTVISACRRIEKALEANEPLAWTSSVGERSEEAQELVARLEERCRAMR
ncbi:MAG: chromosomal replication initiator protein DnaA [Planctomycetota bacterium]